MNPLLRKLLSRVMAPAGDDGTDLGGTDTAVVDDPQASGGAAAEPEDRGDVIDPAVNAANLKAVLESGAGDADPGVAGDGGEGAGDADGGKNGSSSVPHGRFNEVNTRKKELEVENEQLRRDLAAARAPSPAPAPSAAIAAPAVAAQFDPDAKEQEYVAALVDGDVAKATKIRREINNQLVAEAEARADAKAEQRSQAVLLKGEVADTMKAHPWLDTEEGADALELIVAARDAGIARGQAPHVALRAAVAKIAPKFAPAADAEKAPPAGASGSTAKTDNRSTEAVKRGAADSLKQPPSLQTAGVGNRASETQLNVEEMSDEQFENLSEAEKKKLRGD